MTQSMIFFDLDNTLLNAEKEVPQSAKRAIRALQNDGHIVAIATGRTPFAFDHLLEELDIDTYVSLNGQYVVSKGEVIYRNPLNTEALKELTASALEHEHPIVYIDHKDWTSNKENDASVKHAIGELKIPQELKYDPDYYIGRDIYQALVFCTDGEEQVYEERFDQFDFIRWHPVSVDVLPHGGSKAKGIEKAIEKMGIAPENVYAFGDGLNDIEMLRAVQNSVAMGNAEEIVKEAAKSVTKSVDEDGVEHGLKLVGLLK
ncbi:Cof-type HAD-IIB family hydrolase [Virgibacillus siamensis]|uniref:Cof-type HAD-IIB family hydrolase n=1 Tax=Virgibacillus siamensis TaxID=480071 RepID=UPI00098694E3|nr:Cof-type HAD-IIB family hydrolase [Virgibacillus siamensis]